MGTASLASTVSTLWLGSVGTKSVAVALLYEEDSFSLILWLLLPAVEALMHYDGG